MYKQISIIGLIFILLGCGKVDTALKPVYATWQGIGPDKLASSWLIKHHLEPSSKIEFRAVGSDVSDAIAFDVPSARYRRTKTGTTFKSLIDGHEISDDVLVRVADIIHDIEVDRWSLSQTGVSAEVETAYRSLQETFGREEVPMRCYEQLFDTLYSYLHANGNNAEELALKLTNKNGCDLLNKQQLTDDRAYVSEWSAGEIFAFLRNGKKVVFVDTRETDEFAEGHIPGAINIRLRDIDGLLPDVVRSADVVIPYCVKDFRGFEVAKRFKLMGVKTVGLMKPYGIAGWRKIGLPVVGADGYTEAEGVQRLFDCANSVGVCLRDA